jgi:uncharacterized phage protein (TIGR02218 family)
MRQISEEFAARIAADTTSLCRCWRFARRDGAVFGATDHDAELVFDGVVYAPAVGLELVSLEGSSGLAPGRAAGRGALSLDFIAHGDLDAALWDGARVDVWSVDWQAIEYRIIVWSGVLSEVVRSGGAYSAELVSLKASLERSIGRVYARRCDADVGDARCGVHMDVPAYRISGVVHDLTGGFGFLSDALAVFASGWFTGGRLVWTSGANDGLEARIVRHAGDGLELRGAVRAAIAAGDAFTVTAGCDKAFDTCRVKFSNAARFRGFPHMPGPEAVLSGPAAGQTNDGGRRT